MKDLETRYLERLSDLYPTIAAASTEIINLQAILNLPKGTELVEESFMMCWKLCEKRFFALDKKGASGRAGYHVVYLAPPRIHHCLERIRWRRLNGISCRKRDACGEEEPVLCIA